MPLSWGEGSGGSVRARFLFLPSPRNPENPENSHAAHRRGDRKSPSFAETTVWGTPDRKLARIQQDPRYLSKRSQVWTWDGGQPSAGFTPRFVGKTPTAEPSSRLRPPRAGNLADSLAGKGPSRNRTYDETSNRWIRVMYRGRRWPSRGKPGRGPRANRCRFAQGQGVGCLRPGIEKTHDSVEGGRCLPGHSFSPLPSANRLDPRFPSRNHVTRPWRNLLLRPEKANDGRGQYSG